MTEDPSRPISGAEGPVDGDGLLLPRRRPVQERSRRRVEAILAAAREVLLEDGFESFTLEHVAQRAGVPVGTIYQFFANKYVVVCELDREDTAVVRAELARFAEHLPTVDWPRFVNATVDHLAELWSTDPARRAVWFAVQSTPATRATAAVAEAELAGDVARALAMLTPGLDRERRRVIAAVIVHASYAMLSLSVRDGTPHDQVVVELKRMLHAYLQAAEASPRG